MSDRIEEWEARRARRDREIDAQIIESLSAEQTNQGRMLAEKWAALGRSAARADRALFQEAVAEAYERKKLRPPEVRWFPSPVKGVVPAVFEVLRGSPTITSTFYDQPLRSADDRINFSQDVARVINKSLVDRAGALPTLIDRAHGR